MSERRDAEGAEGRRERLNVMTEAVIGAAIEVHRVLGPGLLESAYQAALEFELKDRGLSFRAQVAVPVVYRSLQLDHAFRADLVVEEVLVVELRAVDALVPIHHAQVLSYLRLLDLPLGLLINFHAAVLKSGIRRVVNGL